MSFHGQPHNLEAEKAVHHAPNFMHQPLDKRDTALRVLQVLPCDHGEISLQVKHISLETVLPPKSDLLPVSSQNTQWLPNILSLLPQQMQKLETLHPQGTAKLATVAYIAVSYTWGSEAASKKILLNGAVFHIRPNLYALLRQASGPNKCQWLGANEYLWIDALCIDQSNIEERNHQVKLMSRIYSHAQQVIVWLGDSSRDVSQVDEIVSQLYWTRMWVVQEFLLATNIKTIMGNKEVRTDKLLEKKYHNDFAGSLCLWRYLNNGVNSKPYLIQVVQKFGHRRCKETKDRLFALLSITSAGEDFPVDYSDTLDVVFWKALIHFRANYGKFDDNDAVAAGRSLLHLFSLKDIPEPPSPRSSPTSSFHSLSTKCHVSLNALQHMPLYEDSNSAEPLFPIRLNTLDNDAFGFFTTFPAVCWCACTSCKPVPDFESYFASASPCLRSGYRVCRTVSIARGTLIFKHISTGVLVGTWQCVAFAQIHEHPHGGRAQLTLFSPPGCGRFLVGREITNASCKLLVTSSVLSDLLKYATHPAHDTFTWKTYERKLLAKAEEPLQWVLTPRSVNKWLRPDYKESLF